MTTTTNPAPTTPDLAADRAEADSIPPDGGPRGPADQSRWQRLVAVVSQHRRTLVVVLPLLALSGAMHAVNMFANPARIDDEGTYTAQAWAVEQLGQLAHYTYWYDHPPLGWLQLAGWTSLTNAFSRVSESVYAGREFMLVVQLVSVVLVWLLCRRLGMARWASALAVVVFGLSPLAIQFHRTVFLDNIATPWLLGAFVLAASPRRRLGEYAGAAVCFGVAVLTKETSLLLLPALGLLMWQSAPRETRRYSLTVAASLLAAIGTAYVLLAVVKGEVLPRAGQVSLLEGIQFQLAGRAGGGSVFDPTSLNFRTASVWFSLDWLTPVLALLATPIALATRRLRPLAVGFVILALMLVRPGYLPVPFIIAAIPFMAVLVGGGAEVAWQWLPQRARTSRRGRLHTATAVAAVVGVTVVAVAIPAWGTKHRGLLLSDPDAPLRAAETWISDNVPRDHRVIIDDAIYVDLVADGFDRSDVVWYYKMDTDPAVQALAPRGWQDYDWLVSTESIRQAPDSGSEATLARDNSVPVARFGEGDTMVEVRRVVDQGVEQLPDDTELADDAELRSRLGSALDENPAVTVPDDAADLLRDGQVDERLLSLLAAAGTSWDLDLRDVPQVFGEEAIEAPRRVAVLTSDDQPALQQWLADQDAVPGATVDELDGALAVTVPAAVPGTVRAVDRAP